MIFLQFSENQDTPSMAFLSKTKPGHKSSRVQPLKSCRICFCDDNQHDILTNVCGCRGSLAYVHRSCIKEWILSSTEFTFSTARDEKIYCRTCQCRLSTSKIFISDQQSPSPTTGCCSWRANKWRTGFGLHWMLVFIFGSTASRIIQLTLDSCFIFVGFNSYVC